MNFLLGEMNAYLGAMFPNPEPRAVLSGLVTPDGQPLGGIGDRIVLSLTGIERETAAHLAGQSTRTQNIPPLNLNLYIMVSSSFTAYGTGLGFLSSAIGFLHAKPVFTPQNSAAFPKGMERLSIEMVNMNLQDQQNLWGALGGKYAPSAFYKARMVTLQDGWLTDSVPVITASETKV
jgi:hypothetical protein